MSKIYTFTAASYADIQVNPEGSPNRLPRHATTLAMVRNTGAVVTISLGTYDSTGTFVALTDLVDGVAAAVDAAGEIITLKHPKHIDLYLHCSAAPTGIVEVKCGS